LTCSLERGGYQVGIIKDSIVRNGSLRVALAELQEEAVPSIYIDVLREVDEGINELKSRWAKMRKSTARLSDDSLAAIDQGLDSGLPVVLIAQNARTTLATVYRHAQKRRAG
jgi:hypothetical protein